MSVITLQHELAELPGTIENVDADEAFLHDGISASSTELGVARFFSNSSISAICAVHKLAIISWFHDIDNHFHTWNWASYLPVILAAAQKLISWV